jgi:hypothetical protein
MKNYSDTIGSRTRDLPVCSKVSQPLRHRVREGQLHFYNTITLFFLRNSILILLSRVLIVIVIYFRNKLCLNFFSSHSSPQR